MTSFVLSAGCAGLCALNIYLGFVRPTRVLRHYAQTGAIVFFLLALFSAYFGWREFRAVDELAALIQPVPEVVGVLYVPTAGEIRVMARAMERIPGSSRAGTTQAERQRFADNTEGIRTRYWRLDTTLSSESVMAFYRDQRNRPKWEISTDSEPSLTLKSGSETLIIYTRHDRLRSVTEVWFLHSQEDE
jgi:hypothetical protein